MSQWQDQIQINANAIAQMLADGKQIKDHAYLGVPLLADDKFIIQLASTDVTVYAKYSDIIGDTLVTNLSAKTTGDILAYDGSVWINLAAGTNGYHLISNNATASGLEWVVSPGLQNLQSVCDEGSTTTTSIRTQGYEVGDANALISLITDVLTLANDDVINIVYTGGATFSVGLNGIKFNSLGVSDYAIFENDFLTADRTIQVPNASGMFALSVNNYIPDALGNIIVPNISMPLTTKGDLFTWSTGEDRLAIGIDGQVLTADSGEPTGLIWASIGGGDMLLGTIQTITALKTFEDGTIALRNVANTFSVTFTNTISANRVATYQDKSGTVAYLSDITTYIHNQTIPATVWNISHGLNRYPSVTAVDTSGAIIGTQVVYTDANNIIVTINEVGTGKVYLNY